MKKNEKVTMNKFIIFSTILMIISKFYNKGGGDDPWGTSCDNVAVSDF